MTIIFLLVFWAMLAFIPALIARKKGRSPYLWAAYGFAAFPVATTHALLIEWQAAPQTAALTPGMVLAILAAASFAMAGAALALRLSL